MVAGGVIAVSVLIRSNLRFRNKQKLEDRDTLFQTILSTEDSEKVWPLLLVYINEKEIMFLQFARETYKDLAEGFIGDNSRLLSKAEKSLRTEKGVLKGQRRKLTLCLRKVKPETAIEKSTWFHLYNDMAMSMMYNLLRITEVCKEHVENNFRPLPKQFHESYSRVCMEITDTLQESENTVSENCPEKIDRLRKRCEEIKTTLTLLTKDVYDLLQRGDTENMTVAYVYLNVLQESQEFVTSLRKMLRASGKLNLAPSSYRSFTSHDIVTHPRT